MSPLPSLRSKSPPTPMQYSIMASPGSAITCGCLGIMHCPDKFCSVHHLLPISSSWLFFRITLSNYCLTFLAAWQSAIYQLSWNVLCQTCLPLFRIFHTNFKIVVTPSSCSCLFSSHYGNASPVPLAMPTDSPPVDNCPSRSPLWQPMTSQSAIIITWTHRLCP